MRILLLNHFPLFGSGSGVYTLNIANSLVNLGHEVSCIFPDNTPDETKYNFRTHAVMFTPSGMSASSAPNAQVEKDKKASEASSYSAPLPFNFPCFTTHPKSSRTFESLTETELNQYTEAFRAAIKQEIETFKPDVIHAGHIWILPAIASEFDVPVIITAHGTDIIGYKQSARYHNTAKLAAQSASAIVSISKRNFNEVCETFPFAKEKTILISNGYDENKFYPEKVTRADVLARYGITREYKHMVSFAGKFTHFKGIDILLRAASEYENEDTLTLMVGAGDLFEEMKSLARSLGLMHVEFIGAQTPDALRYIYSVADVSCAPSRREPFGLVVIEAGACGTPVIGTNGGGIADILTANTGILIDEEDAPALARAVQDVLSGARTFNREEIAKYTREHFAQTQYTKKLVRDVYGRAAIN